VFTTILWDNDGVLVDTEHHFFVATRDVLALESVELPLSLYIEYSLRRGESTFNLVRDSGASEQRIADLRNERNRRYADALRTQRILIEDVEWALSELRCSFSMGVVTSSRRDHFDIMHRRTGLAGYFDFVVALEDYKQTKPAPDPYLTALKQNGLQAQQCVVIEDSERGLTAAKAAGLTCYVIPNELTRFGNFDAADKVLASIKDLVDRLQADRA